MSPTLNKISLLSPNRYIDEYKDKTRTLAIADKQRDAFRGQSRSPNMVPFHMLGMVSYYRTVSEIDSDFSLQNFPTPL